MESHCGKSMSTSESATAVWEEGRRGADLQNRVDRREWMKNFALVSAAIVLTLAIVAAMSGSLR
jgi:hypothetical protein